MPKMNTLTINETTYDIVDDGAVRFDSAQNLTPEQKAQARENIDVDQLIARKSGPVVVINDARPVRFKGLIIPDNSENYAIRLYGKNIFDMDTVLPSLTNPYYMYWTKESDGSYSLGNLGVFVGQNQPWWKNTSGYNGQISISLDAKQSKTDVNVQTMEIYFVYTDGTGSRGVICDCIDEFKRYTATSIAGKTVAYIDQGYQASVKTYVRNIMINYGDVTTYEPFAGEQHIIVSSSDTSAFTDCKSFTGWNTIVSNNNTDITVEYVVDPILYADCILNECDTNSKPNKLVYYASRLPVIKFYGDTSVMSKDTAVDMIWKLPYEETQGGCKVKWQGDSSLKYPKKNYTVKFGHFPHEEYYGEYMPGWTRETKYCLKANWIDSSHLRNIFSAKMWGKIVKSRSNPNEKLNALPNGGAIDGFPCIVMINDEFTGLYTWNIPKDGWMMGMGNGTHECILCASGNSEYLSNLFIETEQELDQGFDLEYISDENDTEWALTSLNNLITAVMNQNISELNNLLDWDSVIDYLILCYLIGNIDGFNKNYLLSTYDGMKWFITPYDMDSTFGLYPSGYEFISVSSMTSIDKITNIANRLLRMVVTHKKAELKARYIELRNGILSEDNIYTDIDNFARAFPADIYAEEYGKWNTPNSSINGPSQMKEWYRVCTEILDEVMQTL